jgi:hypothetical protein
MMKHRSSWTINRTSRDLDVIERRFDNAEDAMGYFAVNYTAPEQWTVYPDGQVIGHVDHHVPGVNRHAGVVYSVNKNK